MYRYIAAAVAAGFLMSAGPAPAQEKLTVFWGKGFYKAEDDALFAAVKKFEEKAKVKIDISQYSPQDMIPKTVAAGCRLWRRVRLPGRWQMGLRGQARGPVRHHQPVEGAIRAEHARDDVPL